MLVDKFKSIFSVSINISYFLYPKGLMLQSKTFAHNAKNHIKMPSCKYVPSTYMGKSYDELKKAHESIVSPSLKPFYKEPLIIHEGRGQWLWDHQGKRYLDMFGGVATISVGHSHPKIVAAISEQSSKLNHVSSVYMQPRLHEYVTRLISKFSEKLNVVYLTNSGSEANELAFLMARLHTRSQNIVSLKNCYHGATYGTSASTSLSNWKYPFIVQPPGYIHIPHFRWYIQMCTRVIGVVLSAEIRQYKCLERIVTVKSRNVQLQKNILVILRRYSVLVCHVNKALQHL